jgi:DNA-binding NarL/FixJ family response regulator
METGAVWIIDNDADDREMVREIWDELQIPNPLCFFESAEETMAVLAHAEAAPFIIICELHLPRIDGFELRRRMLTARSKKFRTVPFIYWCTNASEEQITHAYELSAHGLFIKETSFEELKNTFSCILNYWLKSKMPSKKVKSY